MLWLLSILAVPAALAYPGPEAQALGRRVAASGPFAALGPMLVEKDVAELAAAHKQLSEIERQRLITLACAEGAAGIARMISALGAAYAKALSVEDLRVLAGQE